MDKDPKELEQPTYVYYDGWCSACIKSAKLFTKLDSGRSLVVCIDLRSDDDRIALTNLDQHTLASSLHTLTPDGTLHAGPEAIRQAFAQLGKRRATSWTRLPIIKPIVDLCYRIFAKNRLRWFATHQCTIESCNEQSCTIDHQHKVN
ncbi:MAG: thiol-disulfide oxidoreductase DCC family protein [Phycisphaerales bacterium]